MSKRNPSWRNRTCSVCHAAFVATGTTQRMCAACGKRTDAHRRKNRSSDARKNMSESQREELLARRRERNKAKRDAIGAFGIKVWRPIVCVTCRGEFTPTGARQKRCNACRKEYQVAVWRERQRSRDKENRREYMLRYAAENAEKLKENGKKYRAQNLAKERERLRIRRATDPSFRLRHSMRSLVRIALKKQATRRYEKLEKLVGTSARGLMEYLLSHPSSRPEFNCDNYGAEWSVDHIRPLATFDLQDPSQRKEAFHYTNCQPMTKAENSSKGSLYNGRRHLHRKVVS